jgi:SAM-dependent methyltransferase
VDRVYIEEFLQRHVGDIRGRVMEIDDSTYTRRFGGERVEGCEILHVDPNNPRATMTADLSKADHIPSALFDCLIVTQTLHLIYDVSAAIATLYRILKPGGVLLVTVPGISQISQDEWKESWYWSFTRCSLRRLFGEVFTNGDVQLEAYGNVLAATAFLYGLAAEELSSQELAYHDPQFEMLIAVRAVKPLDTP